MASQQTIRDRQNRAIGYIETDSSGVQTLRDARFTFKGSYNPKDDVTRDYRHHWVGKGNLLMTLL